MPGFFYADKNSMPANFCSKKRLKTLLKTFSGELW